MKPSNDNVSLNEAQLLAMSTRCFVSTCFSAMQSLYLLTFRFVSCALVKQKSFFFWFIVPSAMPPVPAFDAVRFGPIMRI